MIIKVAFSYLLLFTTMLMAGMIATLSDVEIPKWFNALFGAVILIFPLLLVGIGFYFIWVE
jgi:uncharacterized BrkB/YihY/UPF0761 family membrane protein